MNTIVNDNQTDDWPPSINAVYEKVRPLGEGAYGIVWLAKTKKPDDKTAGPSMIHYHPQLGDDGVESTLLDDKDKKKEDDDSVEDGEKEEKKTKKESRATFILNSSSLTLQSHFSTQI